MQNTGELPSSHDMPLIRWRCWLAIISKPGTRPVAICTNSAQGSQGPPGPGEASRPAEDQAAPGLFL